MGDLCIKERLNDSDSTSPANSYITPAHRTKPHLHHTRQSVAYTIPLLTRL